MNHMAAALQMANLIVDITDPKLTRARREQLSMQARALAKNYTKRIQENGK